MFEYQFNIAECLVQLNLYYFYEFINQIYVLIFKKCIHLKDLNKKSEDFWLVYNFSIYN